LVYSVPLIDRILLVHKIRLQIELVDILDRIQLLVQLSNSLLSIGLTQLIFKYELPTILLRLTDTFRSSTLVHMNILYQIISIQQYFGDLFEFDVLIYLML